MNVKIYFAPTFSRKYKHYAKKFKSLQVDLNLFISEIEKTHTDKKNNFFIAYLTVTL